MKSITIDGVTYRSQRAASLALGLSESAINARINYQAHPENNKRKAITLDGVEYESQAAAARALGVTSATISRRMRKVVRNEEVRRYYLRTKAVKIADLDVLALAQRLMLHFPEICTVEALFVHALRELAARTDD